MTERPGAYTTLRPGDAVRVRDPGDLRLGAGQVVGEYLAPWPYDARIAVRMPAGYVRVALLEEWELVH